MSVLSNTLSHDLSRVLSLCCLITSAGKNSEQSAVRLGTQVRWWALARLLCTAALKGAETKTTQPLCSHPPQVAEAQKEVAGDGAPASTAQQAQQAAALAAAVAPVDAAAAVAASKPLEAPEPDQYTVIRPKTKETMRSLCPCRLHDTCADRIGLCHQAIGRVGNRRCQRVMGIQGGSGCCLPIVKSGRTPTAVA